MRDVRFNSGGGRDSNINVGIVCPAPIEYRECCKGLKLVEGIVIQGRHFALRSEDNINVVAVEAGPGKIACASATQLIIDRFRPEVVIDVGGSGSLSSDVDIFEVVCAENAYEYDVCPGIDVSCCPDDLTTWTLIWELTEKGKAIFQKFVESMERGHRINLISGSVASGEKNVDDSFSRAKLKSMFQAVACNWETSAVLRTAHMNGIRSLSFRVITDHAGEEMSDELGKNWENALVILYSVVEEFVFGGWLLQVSNTLHSRHAHGNEA